MVTASKEGKKRRKRRLQSSLENGLCQKIMVERYPDIHRIMSGNDKN